MKVKALKNKILALMVDRPDGFKKTKSGLITMDKDNDVTGIRPRWFQVYSVGEGIDWLREGQYVFVAHGRWSNGVKIDEDTKLYLLDNEECLAVQDEDPMQ
jgi:co-chaperonin GroES (HSP10)